MGIEPSSYSPDVAETKDDKYDHRPKPSKLPGSIRENRCECGVLVVTASAWHEPTSKSWVT